jgi:hypothetical protein
VVGEDPVALGEVVVVEADAEEQACVAWTRAAVSEAPMMDLAGGQ